MELSRRKLIQLGLGATAACAAGLGLSHASAAPKKTAKKKIPIGLQLYSVRNECAKDLPGVLQQVKQMGYEGVEFAGYYGRKADELRKLLDDNGLKCCGTHTGLNTLQGDALKATVEFNQTLGNPYLIVPGMPHKMIESLEAIKTTAKLYSDLAEKVKPDAMRVGYHAHGGDFRKVGDETAWDLLFTFASPAVLMQMDVGNCIGGGGDPYKTLARFPGRSLTIHLKEHGGKPGAPVGEGEVDWDKVFDLCETVGGTEWYIVEHESDPKTPIESVRKCLVNLKKMLAKRAR